MNELYVFAALVVAIPVLVFAAVDKLIERYQSRRLDDYDWDDSMMSSPYYDQWLQRTCADPRCGHSIDFHVAGLFQCEAVTETIGRTGSGRIGTVGEALCRCDRYQEVGRP